MLKIRDAKKKLVTDSYLLQHALGLIRRLYEAMDGDNQHEIWEILPYEEIVLLARAMPPIPEEIEELGRQAFFRGIQKAMDEAEPPENP